MAKQRSRVLDDRVLSCFAVCRPKSCMLCMRRFADFATVCVCHACRLTYHPNSVCVQFGSLAAARRQQCLSKQMVSAGAALQLNLHRAVGRLVQDDALELRLEPAQCSITR